MTGPIQQRTQPASGYLRAMTACLVLCGLTACTPTLEYGYKADISALEELEVKTARKADVLLALGEPRGKGAAEFVKEVGRPRDIWYYEYMLSDGKAIKLMILAVFFIDDSYDGYWWFSSIEDVYCKSKFLQPGLRCEDP